MVPGVVSRPLIGLALVDLIFVGLARSSLFAFEYGTRHQRHLWMLLPVVIGGYHCSLSPLAIIDPQRPDSARLKVGRGPCLAGLHIAQLFLVLF